MFELRQAKRALQNQLVEIQALHEALEDDLQINEESKKRLVLEIQTQRLQFDRDLQAVDQMSKEVEENWNRKMRDLNSELDLELNSKAAVVIAKKKLETELKDLQDSLNDEKIAKDGALKLVNRLETKLVESTQDAKVAMAAKEGTASERKKSEGKVRKVRDSQKEV